MKLQELRSYIQAGKLDERLKKLYVDESVIPHQQARYLEALNQFEALYGDQDVMILSAPGRSEVGGNHTDHQHGRVLAASINLDAIGIVAKKADSIKIKSDDFDLAPIMVSDTAKKEDEKGTSESLVRGILAKFKEAGHRIGGFEAYITSEVLIGAGLSSSAAFEVLIGTILSYLYNDGQVDAIEIAQIGQYAENEYFGKPCGLMDQCASSVGSLVYIDFKDPNKPVVDKVEVDFASFKHTLCIVDTKGSHSDLTPDYAAVPFEMKEVAQALGQEVLGDIDENDFYTKLGQLRAEGLSDRAMLRAIHFFEENKRVPQLVQALRSADFEAFKQGIQASGRSSFQYLQNVYSPSHPHSQGVALGLAISEQLLGSQGVCRVHGGGFAGTIQAFVPDDMVAMYQTKLEAIFGQGSCHLLKIRPEGGTEVIA